MTDELSRPNQLLRTTDWSKLEHAFGVAAPETPMRLAALLSHNRDEVFLAVDHLVDMLLHQGSIYPATGPAALYVAAILTDRESKDRLRSASSRGGRPLRGVLLGWLAELAYAASDERARLVSEWTGQPTTQVTPLVRGIRTIRPVLFDAVAAYLADSDPRVRQNAIIAAIHLLDAPELMPQRASLSPLVRDLLATTQDENVRAPARRALELWGEDVSSPMPPEDGSDLGTGTEGLPPTRCS